MIHHGDCLDLMPSLARDSFDAIVTDPPYDLTSTGARRGSPRNPGTGPYSRGFMGKAWDGTGIAFRPETWAAALRVAKPSSYLLAFGGTRTVHRMAVAIEDAGWIIRDMLVWAYASGFPKSKASLKPAWEPIVMARKPGPLRMLAIDECRIPFESEGDREDTAVRNNWGDRTWDGPAAIQVGERPVNVTHDLGRWPANVVLTDAVFGDEYSRFFLVPKADRGDREPVLGGLPIQRGGAETMDPRVRDGAGVDRMPMRQNVHPTVKPTELMRHLVRLVTPSGGTVLDPFLGSGTTGIACELEGFPWIGIEKEAEYVAIAEARLNGTQRGMGLSA